MAKKITKPSERTRRSILSHTANQCAFPTCTKPIHSDGEMLGQIAHIKGRKYGSARFDPAQPPEERNGYYNLIAVCHEHGQLIDDPTKVSTYTVDVLTKYKLDHEKKIEERADRNWLLPPNTIAGGNFGGMTVHFWYDRNGDVQVYSDDQLAACNALMSLNISLSNISTTFQALRSHGDHKVSDVMCQHYAKVGEGSDNMYAHLSDFIAVASDVTFGEFMRFIVKGNDATKLVEHGETVRREMIEGKRRQFWRNPKRKDVAQHAAKKVASELSDAHDSENGDKIMSALEASADEKDNG